MKKYLAVIPITILIILLSIPHDSFATTLAQFPVVFVAKHSNVGTEYENYYYLFGTYDTNYIISYNESNNRVSFYRSPELIGYSNVHYFETVEAAYTFYVNNPNADLNYFTTSSVTPEIVVIHGTLQNRASNLDIYESYDDYVDANTPTWWDTFYDWYEILFGYEPADDSLFGYIRSWFEEEDDGSSSGIRIIVFPTLTPLPTPTPIPTPIPYSTSIVPITDPNTGEVIYQYTYNYYDDNGNPVTATAPPPQVIYLPSGNDGSGSDKTFNQNPIAVPTNELSMFYQFAYDTNEQPNPLEQDPKTDLQNTMTIIEKSIDDYSDPINVVSEAMNTLPSDWIWLLGICAGIIFISGIISRFLGG